MALCSCIFAVDDCVTYFYFHSGCWHFAIYARYPHRDYFYFHRPAVYVSYRGGHSWRQNNGRSWYSGRTFGSRRGDNYFGIAQGIMEKMGRGATLLNATGAYSGAERKVVLCAVRNNEYPRLRELIKQCDPQAFLITTNVNEVLGEGFVSLNAKNLT